MKTFTIISTLLILSTTLALALNQQQSLEATILPGGIEMQIFSPAQNQLFNERRVQLDIATIGNIVLESLEMSDNGKRFRSLCRRCSLYFRQKTFKDGFHKVIFQGTHEVGTQQNKTVNFTVDSKKPNIRKTDPQRGFADGNFHVEFKEDNPTSLYLNYGNTTELRTHKVNLSECMPDNRDTICWTFVNLTDFNNQKILYFFNMTDIVNRSAKSRERELDVDTISPKINEFNFTQNGRFINFFFNITEKNLDIIHYIDHESSRPRFKRLCTRLKDDVCEKRKSFRKGDHNLTIEIIDDAENKASIENIIFNVT
jgi:hypothetical protein